VFPARAGDGVRAYVMKARREIPYPTGFASLAVERVFDLLTITLLGGSVLVGYVLTGSTTAVVSAVSGGVPGVEPRSARVALTVAAGVAAAAVLAVATIVVSARREGNLVRRLVTSVSSDSYADYVAGVLESFVVDVQTVAADRAAFARIGATSLAIWALDVVTAVLVLAAFDVGLATPTLVAVGFFAVSVGNLAKVLPLSPGGIGLYEAAFTLLVAGLTPVAGATAFGAAVLDHAVKNLVTVAGGVVSMLSLNVSLTTAVDETGTVEPDSEPETVE
jgi:hypothetical protein